MQKIRRSKDKLKALCPHVKFKERGEYNQGAWRYKDNAGEKTFLVTYSKEDGYSASIVTIVEGKFDTNKGPQKISQDKFRTMLENCEMLIRGMGKNQVIRLTNADELFNLPLVILTREKLEGEI